MGIAEDLLILETRLRELITSYEQYFIGLEKREPLKLLAEVDTLVRRYATSPINNTMHKHRYNNMVARLSSYRQHWNRIIREIEEGRYSRDRFKATLHETIRSTPKPEARKNARPENDIELDRIYNELLEARKLCNLPLKGLSREQLAETIAKQQPVVAQKLGTQEIRFRVVVENGKPKIKAGLKHKHDE